ncbi:hypothetical protein CFAM422_007758 [Trichoderma lentiforme]|uniref:Fe2OG dioxygenase domain-containing protein n=1 Tax=Trichoderma lentiforme TaxID=1567552 RepID=A0A9P4XCJ6_9HYPO|nr:hypothetical protein CFAM422_007758 [Trichoderma lentiforme]
MAKSKSSKSSAPAQAAPPPPPSWPVFKPPLPVVELYPELHPANSHIVLLSSFFPRSLCRDYVAFLKTLPLQTTPSRPKKGEAVRVNDRGGEPVGLNPNIRIYRYSKGQYFDCHYDDSNNLVLDSVPVKTTWTLLLYLTSSAEGCIGGETVFYPHDRKSAAEEIAVSLETGMLLLHKHGDDCLLHEGREVQDGEKWVLRTDLCVRRG